MFNFDFPYENQELVRLLWFYFPLGVIGLWRWSVWSFKKITGLFYRTPKGSFEGSLAVVTPVYNEDPEMFKLALQSWKENNPQEIIAVIDYTDKENIKNFKEFQKNFSGAKLIVTETPGKRPALADGVKASTSEIVALVDSDTIWGPHIKKDLLGPFEDSKVGGVSPRQDVLKDNTLARRLFKIRLDIRFLNELTFLTTVGNAITCLSGRTAVYRKKAIIDLVDKMVNEKFMGKQVISGDDKSLTYLVQGEGWKTVFLRYTKVYTPGAPDLFTYFLQQVRWTRNSWRADLQALFRGWIWKREKFLTLYLLDRFVQPFTLLLAPTYFIVSLIYEQYLAVAIISGWWIFSRFIQIFPHLREKPLNVLILPFYVLTTFILAVIKIFTLITVDKQGWITRWNKSRMEKYRFFYEVPTYVATSAIVVFIFSSVFVYQRDKIELTMQKRELRVATELRKTAKAQEQLRAFEQINTSANEIDEAAISKTGEELLSNTQKDTYAYYRVERKDTLSQIARRFNLPNIGIILNADKTPVANPSSLVIGQQLAIPLAELRNPLSPGNVQSFALTTLVTYDPLTDTIQVKGPGSVVNLARIRQLLPPAQRQLIEQTAPKEWILRSNLEINDYITLVLDQSEINHLKLKSEREKFVWIKGDGANILINGIKVSSWDEALQRPDDNPNDGRAFITVKESGRMDILNSEIFNLGHAGVEKRGGSFGGSYGISWKITDNTLNSNLLTGVVINSDIHHNYFGLYSFGATGIIIRGNNIHENVQYGIDPHDDSNNLIIENNIVYRNGNHGIIGSKRCFNMIIRNNESYENAIHGIMLDRQSNNNYVYSNKVLNNKGDGIAIYDSHENVIANNEVTANERSGVRLSANSSSNFIENNEFTQGANGMKLYDGAQNNYLVNNKVHENNIGLSLDEGAKNIYYNSLIRGENAKDFSYRKIETDSKTTIE